MDNIKQQIADLEGCLLLLKDSKDIPIARFEFVSIVHQILTVLRELNTLNDRAQKLIEKYPNLKDYYVK